MPQTSLNPSTLKEYPQGSIEYQLDKQFVDEHVAIQRAKLQKVADQLGIPLTEENLPVIAQEMRAMKAAKTAATSSPK